MLLRIILSFLILFLFSCIPAREDVIIPVQETISPKIQSPIPFVKDDADQEGTYYIALETNEFLYQEDIQKTLQFILSNYHTDRGKLQVTNIRVLTLDSAQPMIFLKYFRKLNKAKEVLSQIQGMDSFKDYVIDSYTMSQQNFRLILGNRSGLTQYHEFMADQ